MWSLIIHQDDGPILCGAKWKGNDLLLPGAARLEEITVWCKMAGLFPDVGWPYEGKPIFWFGNPNEANMLIEAWS